MRWVDRGFDFASGPVLSTRPRRNQMRAVKSAGCQQFLANIGAEASSQASSSGAIQGSGMRTISFKRRNRL
jgi:hypothetical protein